MRKYKDHIIAGLIVLSLIIGAGLTAKHVNAAPGSVQSAVLAVFANCSSSTKCNPAGAVKGTIRFNRSYVFVNTTTATAPVWYRATLSSF